MALTKSLSDDGKTLSIAVSGRFDFAAHQEFRDAYERAALKPSRYVVDLHDVPWPYNTWYK